MKNLKLIFSTICLLVFTAILKAQDDPNVGIYVDGVKATELSCGSVKRLTAVLPYNSAYDNYDKFQISLLATGSDWDYGYITKISLKANNIKGKYFVYDLYTEKSDIINFKKDPGYETFTTRGILVYYNAMNGKPEEGLKIRLEGMSITSYTEKYDENCSCIKKEPQYTKENIGETEIPLKNRIKVGVYKASKSAKVDMSQSCAVTGSKVDFNNLNASSVNNGSGDVIKGTPNSVNETKATNGNTSSFPSTSNAKALKPLDKNKTGYFSEKAGSKIIREGYKKGDDMNGEVRMYDDEGRLEHIYTYINNEANGYEAEYDPETGNILSSGNNKAGSKDGEWKRYNNGKVVGTDTYVDGDKQ